MAVDHGARLSSWVELVDRVSWHRVGTLAAILVADCAIWVVGIWQVGLGATILRLLLLNRLFGGVYREISSFCFLWRWIGP